MTSFLDSLPEEKGARVWLTIGNMDGVHLGHQALISALKNFAAPSKAKSGLITFYPHPRVFMNDIHKPFYLTTRIEKEDLLAETGLDTVITLPFNERIAKTNGRDFFTLLISRINLAGITVGANFRFGHDHLTAADLEEFCRESNVEFEPFPVVEIDGSRVSTSRVKLELAAGNMAEVSRLLGRQYAITADVNVGRGLGGTLGFPTTNQYVHPMKLLPRFGVYATRATIRGQEFLGVTNVGIRPTFKDNEQPSIETLLFDFDADVYHESLKVEFIQFMREENKFQDVSDLVAQIELDKINARRILTHGTET